jgi:hypothetical protein
MRKLLILVLVLLLAALVWTFWPKPNGEVGASLVAQAAPAG